MQGGKKAQKPVLFKIESQEQFLEKISAENPKLICIDVHLDWCGRCDSMEPSYRQLHMTFDEDYKTIEFFSATEEFIPEEILGGLTEGPLTCKPRFLIFFEGEKKAEVAGAVYPRLEDAIGKHKPANDDI